MRTTFGPLRLTVLDIRPGENVPVFRIVRSDSTDDPVFLNSLRSHYELSEEPRKVERRSTVIHMGISVYVNSNDAVRTARRWPRLGDYVAHLELRSDMGFNFAHTGQPGHLTIWGEPVKLRDAAVDIETVER
jgi:hypothetical protein